jgi:hypothetical protein
MLEVAMKSYNISHLPAREKHYAMPYTSILSNIGLAFPFFVNSFVLKHSLEHKTIHKKPLLSQAVVGIVESILSFLGRYSYFLHSKSLFEM